VDLAQVLQGEETWEDGSMFTFDDFLTEILLID
jgi:hypothetical protein